MLANIPKTQKMFVMVGAMLALLLAALDQTIVATALPRIVEQLNGLQHLSWVVTAYLLTSTISIPIYGKLSDIYGRKPMYLIGILIFVVASVLSGFSQDMTQLILFRGLQGIGAGAIMTNSFAIVGDLFSPSERGKWQGLISGVFGLASVIGPLLGGWVTDNLTWRWNFFINVPVGIVAFLFILTLMPHLKPDLKDKTIDYLGAFMLGAGLTCLLLGLVWGGSQYPWNSWQEYSIFLAAIDFTLLFVIVESRAKAPLLPLEFFKNSIFSLSAVIVFMVGIAMFGAILYIPFFAQVVLGESATNSGTIITPLVFALFISSIVTGQLVSRLGKYKMLAIAGSAIIVGGLYWLSTLTVNSTNLDLIFRMIVVGVGIGIAMPIFNIVVQNAFDHSKLGVVTASVQLFRSIGATVGTAVMGTILNNSLITHMGDLSHDPFVQASSKFTNAFAPSNINVNSVQQLLQPSTLQQVKTGLAHLPSPVQMQILQEFASFTEKIRSAVAISVGEIYFFGMFFAIIALVASLFLKEIPLRKTHGEAPAAAA